MQQRPNEPANKGRWDDWVEDSAKWMVQHEWLTAEEAVGLSAKALSTAQHREVSKDTFPEGVQDEVRQYEEARRGVVIQLESLERHPYRASIAESPAGSELSTLPEVLEILQRNKDWAIREVDRRAYGREGQKPAKFLTNRPAWGTKRRTWNGRCCAGKCTGRLMKSGKTEHPKRTLANPKEKRVDCGEKIRGRREWTVKAVVNAIERQLIGLIGEA